MSIIFFQYVGKYVKDFHWQKVMIASAFVSSKVSTTKRFKPRCLCYWPVDSPYLEN